MRTKSEQSWDYLKNLPFEDAPINKIQKSDKRKKKQKEYLDTRTFEQRSEYSKKGWNKEEGYEERRKHISNLGKEYAEVNRERLRKMNQDSELQSKRGKKGGAKGGNVSGNKVYYCNYCDDTYKGIAYNRYHGEKCKKNPNRVIEYKYELVMDGKSYGKFEEKQGIAEYLECSAALVSRYMSGKKKDIKGYQIITL